MPRKPRFNLPGAYQHVVQQGNNREPCFFAVDDYYRYLDDLHYAAENNQVAIQAYRELFRHHLDDTQVHAIRDALSQELVHGRDDFKDRVEQMLKRQTRPGLPGRPRIEEPATIYYLI